MRSPRLYRQPLHFEIPTCIVLYNITLFIITATKTSYVPLSILKILSAFRMLVKEQSC